MKYRIILKTILIPQGRPLEEQKYSILNFSKKIKDITPNFSQFLTSLETSFVQNLNSLGATNLDFLPKTSTLLNGHGRHSFAATPSIPNLVRIHFTFRD